MLNTLISIVFDGLAYAMILFVISVGLSVTMGLMGFVNLAHGVFAMLGGYLLAILMNSLGLGFLSALILAALLVALLSLLFERFLYAPLYKASELDQVLLSIGLVLMSTAAITYFFGPAPVAMQVPDYLSGHWEFGGRVFPVYRVLMIAFGFTLALGLWLALERTLLGARIRAAVDNRRMAEAVGINVDRLFQITFALGSGLAALGGGLAVEIVGLSPSFASQYLVLFLIVVAVGGMGTIKGSFVAALLLGVIDNGGKYLWPEGGAFFIYLVTVMVLLLKPGGLFGARAI